MVLQCGVLIVSCFLLRDVFNDYILDKRDVNGRAEVIDMELRFSQQALFRDLGRYIHVTARYQPG